MAHKIALGYTRKREPFKLNLRHAQSGKGTNLLLGMAIFATQIPPLAIFAPIGVPARQSPLPRAIFASRLRFLEIPPVQVLFSRGLTLPPQAIFAVGGGHRGIPYRRYMVDRGNYGGEGFVPPARVGRLRS